MNQRIEEPLSLPPVTPERDDLKVRAEQILTLGDCEAYYEESAAFVRDLLARLTALEQERDALRSDGRKTQPCAVCRWPQPANNDYIICECCGFEPLVDDPAEWKARWDGKWFDQAEPKPVVLEAAEAQCVFLREELSDSSKVREELEAQCAALTRERDDMTKQLILLTQYLNEQECYVALRNAQKELAVLRAHLEKLAERWKADAARWRRDEDTPYACEWADTQDECAKDLLALLREPPAPKKDDPPATELLEKIRLDLARAAVSADNSNYSACTLTIAEAKIVAAALESQKPMI